MNIFYPLEKLSELIVYSILGTNQGQFANSLNFFIYDSIKIIILIFFMIFLIGYIRTYLPKHKLKKWLTGKKTGIGNFTASIFGAVTPFCSCSSIPIFISFLEAGIPPGIAFSFLITSPIINEYLVVIMLGLFGFKITALYILSGIAIGTASGIILGRFKLEKYLENDLIGKNNLLENKKNTNFKKRLEFAFNEAKSIVKKIWLWVLVGVGIGAIIHGYIPQEAVQNLIEKTGVFMVPTAALVGIPLYANCAAVVPVALVLFQKGFPLGTALTFMMSTAALSLPEAVILRRAIKLKLIAAFFLIVASAIILTGYLFNILQAVII
ncbi:MAG: permease [Candidatus Undinarchaeales archaeon]